MTQSRHLNHRSQTGRALQIDQMSGRELDIPTAAVVTVAQPSQTNPREDGIRDRSARMPAARRLEFSPKL
jgi:hypothetical protein